MEEEQQGQLLTAVKLAYSQIDKGERIRPMLEKAINPLLEGVSAEDRISLGRELWAEYNRDFDYYWEHRMEAGTPYPNDQLADFLKPRGPALGP